MRVTIITAAHIFCIRLSVAAVYSKCKLHFVTMEWQHGDDVQKDNLNQRRRYYTLRHQTESSSGDEDD